MARRFLIALMCLVCAPLLYIAAQQLQAESELSQAEEFKRVGFSIGLRVRSENMVQFTLDGVTFRIPISQLYMNLENNQPAPSEIRRGFIAIGLWPELGPKTRDNIAMFTGIPTERDSVDRYCATSISILFETSTQIFNGYA